MKTVMAAVVDEAICDTLVKRYMIVDDSSVLDLVWPPTIMHYH